MSVYVGCPGLSFCIINVDMLDDVRCRFITRVCSRILVRLGVVTPSLCSSAESTQTMCALGVGGAHRTHGDDINFRYVYSIAVSLSTAISYK
jgi:hypothetical protein